MFGRSVRGSAVRCSHWLVVAAGVASLGLLALSVAPSAAALPRWHPTSVGVDSRPGVAPGIVVGRLAHTLGGSGGFLYAQDGTCPDGITVFQVIGRTLTQIQQVTIGCSVGGYFGNHHLALATVSGDECLLFSDEAALDSFTISADGQISSSPVSTLSIGDGDNGDLAVSGSTVYQDSPRIGLIYEVSLAPGCMMTLESQNSTNGEADYNIGVANGDVVSADDNTGDMVAYTPQPDGTLTETVNDPGQITSPSGIAVLSNGAITNVYTGQSVSGAPQAQGERFSGTAFTPAGVGTDTDPSAADGGVVAGSATYGILAQANQYSGTIGYYRLTARGVVYMGDTPLEVYDEPTQMTAVGSNLLIAGAEHGVIQDCAMSAAGVSDCHTIAKLPGSARSFDGSVAVILGTP